MRTIANYLKKKTELEAWQVQKIYKESHQAYCIFQKLETIRCDATIDYHLLIHAAKPGDEVVAESKCSFQVVPGLWQKMVDDSIDRAKLVANPAYELCPPWQLPESKNPIVDEKIQQDAGSAVVEIAERVNELPASLLQKNKLVSFEVFLDSYERTLRNHLGLEITMPSTKVTCDFVLLSENEEFEINVFSKRRKLSQFNFEDLLAKESQLLLDVQAAQLPPTGKYAVVLTDEALDTLFDYFISQCSAGAKYFQYSNFEKGQSVFGEDKEAKEPLTLRTDNLLQGAMGAHYFDELGFSLKPLTLIENGIVKDFATDGKMAQLLKWPRTSAFSTVVVDAGVNSHESFLQEGVIELHRFSTFMPNGITGAFSGEIRLGYLYKNGKKIPIRGGSVSGSSQDAFLKCSFSKETTIRENYFGPKAVFFEELTLAGG